MRSLRILQIDGYLSKNELPVPRANLKKKPRAEGIQRSSRDMMFQWNNNNRGQLALVHAIPIPPEGVHTVRAVPTIINSLMDKEDPSFHDISTWANQYYNDNHINIRQIIDGDILQVLNGIHLSGLLVQGNMGGRSVSLLDTEEDDDQEEEGDEEDNPTSKTPDSDKGSGDKEEGDSSGSPDSP